MQRHGAPRLGFPAAPSGTFARSVCSLSPSELLPPTRPAFSIKGARPPAQKPARLSSNVVAVVALTIANFDARGKYPTWSTLICTVPFSRLAALPIVPSKKIVSRLALAIRAERLGLFLPGFPHASSSVSAKDAKCRPTPPPAASVLLFPGIPASDLHL